MSLGEYIPTANTKAYYKFKSDVVSDSSGNNRTLINTGGVTLTNLGKFGGGANFGNTNNNGKYLDYTSAIGLDLAAGATVLIWMKVLSQPTLEHQRFIDLRTGSRYMLLNYVYIGSVYTIQLLTNGKTASYNIQLTTGETYLIGATTKSDGTTALYLNSMLVATGTMASASVDNSLTIGNCRYAANYNIGAIYDDAIFESGTWAQINIQKYYTNALGRFATI